MELKEGKLFFTKNKLLGKRFLSKHMVQLNLELSTKSALVGSQSNKPMRMEPYLKLTTVNQMVNTILQSETLPRRVYKSRLKGVLKDVTW